MCVSENFPLIVFTHFFHFKVFNLFQKKYFLVLLICSESSKKLCFDKNFRETNFSFRKYDKDSLLKNVKINGKRRMAVAGRGRTGGSEIPERTVLGKWLKHQGAGPRRPRRPRLLPLPGGGGGGRLV